MSAHRPKRWQRPRLGPTPHSAWRQREQLSGERGREYGGVVVVRLAYEQRGRLGLPLPPSRFLGHALCREADESRLAPPPCNDPFGKSMWPIHGHLESASDTCPIRGSYGVSNG